MGIGVAVVLLRRTGKAQLLTRRGCGFFNGLLVGMYPAALLAYNLYVKLLFGLAADGTLLPLWRILCFFANMMLVGVAEEFLFRGVVAETLLEHFGTSRGGIWKACLLSGVLFGCAHLTNLFTSAPLGVLMQCVFATSLGVLYGAIYFRTGNLWVTVFLHGRDGHSVHADGRALRAPRRWPKASAATTSRCSRRCWSTSSRRPSCCGKRRSARSGSISNTKVEQEKARGLRVAQTSCSCSCSFSYS